MMIRKGYYFVPSMNNYQNRDEVLILITDFGMGRLFGIDIKNHEEHFEWNEISDGDFEYYFEPATNGEVMKAMFGEVAYFFIKKTMGEYDWWNAPYQKGGK